MECLNTRGLFDLGYSKAVAGQVWATVPPGLPPRNERWEGRASGALVPCCIIRPPKIALGFGLLFSAVAIIDALHALACCSTQALMALQAMF